MSFLGQKGLTMLNQNMLGLALRDVRGPLNDLLGKLDGDEGQMWLASLKRFLRKENPFGDELPDLDWTKVYETLGMSAEFAEFAKANTDKLIPRHGFWVIPVLKGVTPNMVMTAFKKLGVVTHQYVKDLDKDVTENVRDRSYVVWIRKTVEADPDQKYKSADMLAEEGAKVVTLTEGVLAHLGYFQTTGKHLDEEGVTLCAGSRDSVGYVPCVYWSAVSRKLFVDWCCTDVRRGSLCARLVQQ